MAWFSGNTTFNWKNTPRYSGHNWGENVQKIKEIKYTCYQTRKNTELSRFYVQAIIGPKQFGILGKKA